MNFVELDMWRQELARSHEEQKRKMAKVKKGDFRWGAHLLSSKRAEKDLEMWQSSHDCFRKNNWTLEVI